LREAFFKLNYNYILNHDHFESVQATAVSDQICRIDGNEVRWHEDSVFAHTMLNAPYNSAINDISSDSDQEIQDQEKKIDAGAQEQIVEAKEPEVYVSQTEGIFNPYH